MPMPTQPDEPGWWLAVDGRWYPPESAPQVAPTAPVAPLGTAPQPEPAQRSVAVVTGPQLGSPGGPAFHSRGAAPPLPPPNFQRQMTPPMPRASAPPASAASAYATSQARSGEAAAIVSLVLGIVALVGSFWITMALGIKLGALVDLGLGGTSLLAGISARHNGAGGISVAGITVGAVACALSLLWLLDVVMVYAHFGRL